MGKLNKKTFTNTISINTNFTIYENKKNNTACICSF